MKTTFQQIFKPRNRKFVRWILGMGLALVFFASCSQDEVDHQPSCQDRLDDYQFDSVAEDTECTNLERASAELGLGGIEVRNILGQNSADDLVRTFNISADTFESNITHFEKAQELTKYSETRTVGETEIHLFATLGKVVNETYGRIDTDLNGEILEAEYKSFFRIDDEATQSVGQSEILPSNLYQFTDINQNAWLCEDGALTCVQDTNYDGIIGFEDINSEYLVNLPEIEQISVITQVNRLQTFFVVDSTTDLQAPFDYLSMYAQNSSWVEQDLQQLNIGKIAEFQNIVSRSIDQIDNGANCTSIINELVDVFALLTQKAAKFDTPNDYQNGNLLSQEELQGLKSGVNLTMPNVPDGVNVDNIIFNARLIFRKVGGYTGLYKDSIDQIKNNLANLHYLTTDSKGETSQSIAGDRVITMKELFCFNP